MKTCRSCGAQLPEEASFCPYCTEIQNEKQQVKSPRPARKWRWLPICAAAVVMLLLAVWRLPSRTTGEAEPAPEVTASAAPAQESQTRAVPVLTEADSAMESAVPEETEALPEAATQLTYTDQDGEYEIYLCFDNNGDSLPQSSREITVPVMAVSYMPSILVVKRDDIQARDEFLEKLESCRVEAAPHSGYQNYPMGLSEPQVNAQMDAATLMCDVELSVQCGTNDIIWTLEMKNGEVLRLKHTVSVREPGVMNIYPEDQPMNTVEELQALMDRLDQLAGANTIVNIYLPAVTYQGDLRISAQAANLFGAADAEGNSLTTFEGSISVSASQPDLPTLMNLRLIGPGSGTGLDASTGVFLEQCYFSGWDVAVVSNHGGWIAPHYSTFENNTVALRFNTGWHNHTDRGIIYNSFIGNDIAVQLLETACPEELLFDQSCFADNGTDFDNPIDQLLNLSGAIME